MKLSISDSAFQDLENISKYYAEEGVPELGNRITEEIVTKLERLIDHPDLGRVVPEFNLNHIRELIHPPFRLVYLREAKAITIIRVWRSERILLLPKSD
ncbi:type II toxin-antitoxin system RelE/ParE family toxin [Spongiibacter sp. KMU-158]|uniref:Type II toxin-antitoxin system RelE/ParE family toxin n=1 Tax=Spongiibacter pelagi TaxID=2760804 RepID=A0A927GXB0_9GAMM|nr:type II toxin-antitoxin system RelE/ParE family toxin [Spongiibacter pelagi]MBD2859817.1 type II toxin-antitoxin system RelE/ParE family toxin [Spongiibacter pelagi]